MGAPRRVLVTGGAGFVGSHVATYYAEKGADVTVLDNRSRAETLAVDGRRDTGAYNWRYLAKHYPGVDRVEADVRDAEEVEDHVEGHDAVVHTAGQVAVTASLRDPRLDFDVNARGTLNVLEAARKARSDPTVLFTSSNKVYGDNVNEIPIREDESRYRYDDPAFEDGIPKSFPVDGCAHTPYGVSKLAADLYVQDYAERHELTAAVFRMGCIYGPRQFGNEDQGWVAHFAICAANGEPLTVFGDGKQVRDALYVTDLVRAFDAFLSDPADKPVVYNIGGGPTNTISIRECLDVLDATVQSPLDVSFEEWREGDQWVYVSDVSQARDALGWTPRVGFADGIDRFLEWYTRR